MNIVRSTMCSSKDMSAHKREQLCIFLREYVCVVNKYIDVFWGNPGITNNNHLVKSVLALCGDTWLTERAKKNAARYALAKCKSTKSSFKTFQDDGLTNKTTSKKPRVKVLTAQLNMDCAVLEKAKRSTKSNKYKRKKFDAWLHLSSLGNKMNIRIPIKFHKHYYKLLKAGKRCTTFEITEKSIKISFDISTEPKLAPGGAIGLDTGLNVLAATSDGQLLGDEIKTYIERIKRCKHGSKGQLRARRALRHYIDLVCKQILAIQMLTLLTVERLEGITKNTKDPKRRLGINIRRFISAWNVSYFHNRLEEQCEWNCVSFRTVPAYYTSQTCSCCGGYKNTKRTGIVFECHDCGYTDHADLNAAKVILQRFLNGIYSNGYYSLPDKRKIGDVDKFEKIIQRAAEMQQSDLLVGMYEQHDIGTTLGSLDEHLTLIK